MIEQTGDREKSYLWKMITVKWISTEIIKINWAVNATNWVGDLIKDLGEGEFKWDYHLTNYTAGICYLCLWHHGRHHGCQFKFGSWSAVYMHMLFIVFFILASSFAVTWKPAIRFISSSIACFITLLHAPPLTFLDSTMLRIFKVFFSKVLLNKWLLNWDIFNKLTICN